MMDVKAGMPYQRNRRMLIRGGHINSDVEVIQRDLDARKRRAAKPPTEDEQWDMDVLQEMLDECRRHDVDNFGDTPA